MRTSLLVIAALSMAWPSFASVYEGWEEIKSPNFVVYSKAGARTGRHVAMKFEQIRLVFETLFPTLEVDPGKPFQVFLVDKPEDMAHLLPSAWSDPNGKQPSGIFQPGFDKYYAVVLAERRKFSEQVVYHEYVHLMNSLNFPVLSLWLNEGLAEFFELTSVTRRGITIGKANNGHVLTLFQEPMMRLENLLSVDHASRDYHDGRRSAVFYAQAWALTHFLLMDPKARKEGYLNKLMQGLAYNVPLRNATQEAFGDLSKLERALAVYIRKNRFPTVTVKLPIKLKEADFPTRDVSTAEISARVANFFVATHQLERGRTLLRKLARENFSHPLVGIGVGMAHLRRDNPMAALASFEDALSVDPNNVTANYFAGRALNLTAHETVELNRAEEYLARAIRRDPRFAPAYSELAALYSGFEQHSGKALSLVQRAVSLERGNLEHRYIQFDVLMRNGHVDEAVKTAQLMMDIAQHPDARSDILKLLQSAMERQNRNPIPR